MEDSFGSVFLLKRAFDITVSLLGLFLSLPISLLIAGLILLQDGPPIFFHDTRVGRNGKIFKTMKFRSMIKDAEKLTGSVYSVQDDPRITPIGRILRETALDELPQLVSIFTGEMSFVGPRPEKDNYVEEFKQTLPNYDKRHSIRPGLTGPAQIYLKYDSAPGEKLKYDLLYVERASFFRDLQLITKSFAITFVAGWEKFEKNEKL